MTPSAAITIGVFASVALLGLLGVAERIGLPDLYVPFLVAPLLLVPPALAFLRGRTLDRWRFLEGGVLGPRSGGLAAAIMALGFGALLQDLDLIGAQSVALPAMLAILIVIFALPAVPTNVMPTATVATVERWAGIAVSLLCAALALFACWLLLHDLGRLGGEVTGWSAAVVHRGLLVIAALGVVIGGASATYSLVTGLLLAAAAGVAAVLAAALAAQGVAAAPILASPEMRQPIAAAYAAWLPGLMERSGGFDPTGAAFGLEPLQLAAMTFALAGLLWLADPAPALRKGESRSALALSGLLWVIGAAVATAWLGTATIAALLQSLVGYATDSLPGFMIDGRFGDEIRLCGAPLAAFATSDPCLARGGHGGVVTVADISLSEHFLRSASALALGLPKGAALAVDIAIALAGAAGFVVLLMRASILVADGAYRRFAPARVTASARLASVRLAAIGLAIVLALLPSPVTVGAVPWLAALAGSALPPLILLRMKSETSSLIEALAAFGGASIMAVLVTIGLGHDVATLGGAMTGLLLGFAPRLLRRRSPAALTSG